MAKTHPEDKQDKQGQAPSQDNNAPDQSTDQKGKEEKAAQPPQMSKQDMQRIAMQTQQQFTAICQEFGEVGGVNPDTTVTLFKLDEEQSITETDLDQTQLKALIKDVNAYKQDDKNIALGKAMYLGHLFSAYVIQKCAMANESELMDDHIGSPAGVIPAMQGVIPTPLAQFSVFKGTNLNALAAMIQPIYEAVLGEAQQDQDMAMAVQGFDFFVEQIAQQESAVRGNAANSDNARFQMLQSKTIFARLSKEDIFTESTDLVNEGHGMEEGGMVARLQQARQAIENLPGVRHKAPSFILKDGHKLDFLMKPLKLAADGKTMIMADQIGQRIVSMNQDELMERLAKAQNTELLSHITAIIALDVAGKAQKSEAAIGDVFSLSLDKEYNVEDIWVAYDSGEALTKRIASMTAKDVNTGYPYPHEMTMRKLNEDAVATLSLSAYKKEGLGAITSPMVIKTDIFDPAREQAGDNAMLIERLDTFEGAVLGNPKIGPVLFETLQKFFVERHDAESVAALMETHKDDPTTLEFLTKAQADMKALDEDHAEALEEHAANVAIWEAHTKSTLARGAQSDKAYAIWKDIYELPRAEQAAAQLKAFCPVVASDIAEGTVTSDPQHDYIELGLASWQSARAAAVKEALGDMTPMEEALMQFSIDAASDAVTYIMMMEMAAYDPTVFMRKERVVFENQLNKRIDFHVSTGRVNPFDNLDRHILEWRGQNYDAEHRGPLENLVDIVSYNTPSNGEEHLSYHHDYTHFYALADFFNGAKDEAKSTMRDYMGLTLVANMTMSKDAPKRNIREVAKAVAGNKLDSLGITEDRFDQIIGLSTHIANRPAETSERYKGQSLLTGQFVRSRVANEAQSKLETKQANQAPKR